ncbi:MAG: NAD(+) diphosphatase [Myxococcales bacterium]|nr:NAD(+) diphosphatase [Myxococcales bacterium]
MRAAPDFDRACQLREDLDFLEAQLQSDATRLIPVHRSGNLLISRESGVEPFMPTVGAASSLLEGDAELVWLGRLEGHGCFAVDISHLPDGERHPAIPPEVEVRDLRYLLARLPAGQAHVAAYASGMLGWHRRQRFCGACGASTRPRRGGHLRICSASSCGAELFPRLDPAVLVLVQHEDSFLLGRQARWPKGMYSCLAGFVEPMETLEETVVREVAEETGVQVTDVRYQASQPWPFPSSLMIGFTARALSREIHLGDEELEEAAWFTREELKHPTRPDFYTPKGESLSGQLLARFALGEDPSAE